MTDITLADYTGYIFSELVKAREMADRHSRHLAEIYAGDDVLKYFSVPRFKVPKMELTIPVLISGARFQQTVKFTMTDEQKFRAYIEGQIGDVITSIRVSDIVLSGPPWHPQVNPGGTGPGGTGPGVNGPLIVGHDLSSTLSGYVTTFHARLVGNPDPSQPDDIVRDMWTQIFQAAITENKLEETYKKTNPGNELYQSSLGKVMKMVTTNTVVDSTQILNLLVNPETNVVKNGSSDTSVFTVKAEMQEEGFYVRAVTDERTGGTHPVVEFE